MWDLITKNEAARMRNPTVRAAQRATIAGLVAIVVNILLLNFFDAIDIPTARGGLQKLVRLWLDQPLTDAGIARTWASLHLPPPDSTLFRSGFKVGAAVVMALIYALAIEPFVNGSWLRKGLLAAVIYYLINALIVLPLLDEGVAGVNTITPLGMVCYAIAHTAFCLLLAALYAAQKGNADKGLT